MGKKTISELYQECKRKQEMEQLLDSIRETTRETTELFKEQLVEDLFGGPVRFENRVLNNIELNRQKEKSNATHLHSLQFRPESSCSIHR